MHYVCLYLFLSKTREKLNFVWVVVSFFSVYTNMKKNILLYKSNMISVFLFVCLSVCTKRSGPLNRYGSTLQSAFSKVLGRFITTLEKVPTPSQEKSGQVCTCMINSSLKNILVKLFVQGEGKTLQPPHSHPINSNLFFLSFTLSSNFEYLLFYHQNTNKSYFYSNILKVQKNFFCPMIWFTVSYLLSVILLPIKF